MLFPAGRADVLYMIVPKGDFDDPWTISKQIRRRGVTTAEWAIELRFNTYDRMDPTGHWPGTLLEQLHELGLVPPKSEPRAIWADLTRPAAYAHYQYGVLNRALFWSFCLPDGTEVGSGVDGAGNLNIRPGATEFTKDDHPVEDHTGSMPVTPQEVAWLEMHDPLWKTKTAASRDQAPARPGGR